MKTISFKTSVRFKKWTPALAEILACLEIVHEAFNWTPDDLVITSVNDGVHVKNSRHYTDEALDVRSKNFSSASNKKNFVTEMKLALGPQFTVLFESVGTDNEHFHIQVKKGVKFQ